MKSISELLQKLRRSKRLLAVTTIIAGALLSGYFASTRLGKRIELLTIDYRFRLSGEEPLASDIVLVMNDEVSRDEFGEAPYAREVFAALIQGLAKMGARVIGIDFRFEEPDSPWADSLFVGAIAQARNVVIGCYFRELYDKVETNPIQNQETISTVANYPWFTYSPAEAPMVPELFNSQARIGHLNFLIDPSDAQIRRLPLYVEPKPQQQTSALDHTQEDGLRAAFALEMIKAYYGMTDREIKIAAGKLILMPAGHEPIRIPINWAGEYSINYVGFEKIPENYLSWSEVYAKCRQVLGDTSLQAIHSDFNGKIVLIGSLVDEDKSATPFSVDMPGALVHAMVVDNILRERFLQRIPLGYELAVWSGIGVILYWLFTSARHFWQIVGALLLGLAYAGIAILFFHQARLVLPVAAISAFVLAAVGVRAYHGYLAALQTSARLLGRIQQLQENYKLLSANLSGEAGAAAFYRLFILSIEERDQCLFPHWLEFKEPSQPQFAPFRPGPISAPVKIQLNAVRKLRHNLDMLWQGYSEYIRDRKTEERKPVERLGQIGAQIVQGFGVKSAFEELFGVVDKTAPLNLIVSDLKIPWHWAYNGNTRRFLCEEYGVGISLTTERRTLATTNRMETERVAVKPASKMAVLFYGDWNGHPAKQLKHVHDHILALQSLIIRQDCSTMVVRESCSDFLNRLAKANSERDNLRFIHYAGHAEKDMLDVGSEDYLKPGMISKAMGLSFPSRPLVFLNACSSGRLQENGGVMDNLSTEFLACGAGACIVTSFDVYEKTAGRFALIFYDYFVNQKLTAGEALRRTINELGRPDKKNDYDPEYDVTRYFYHLFGDPTVRF